MSSPTIPAKLFSPKFYPHLLTQASYNIFWGGRGSTKSEFVAQYFVLRAMRSEYMKLIYSRKDATQIRESQFSLLKKWIINFNLGEYFTVYEGSMKIVNHLTGNIMIAKGLYDPEDTKGVDEPSHLWMEELPEFDQVDFETLNNSIRTGKTKPQMFGTMNPVVETSWTRTMFFDPKYYGAKNFLPNPIFEGDILLHHSTFRDNPFIDQAAYYKKLVISAAGNEDKLKVNAEGEWGKENMEGRFCWAWNSSQAVPTVHDPERITWATFDFNRNPMTCTIAQVLPEDETVRGIECIKLPNSNIWEMCDRLIASYPEAAWMVTGDQTGQNGSAMVEDNMNYYKIIMQKMHLIDGQIKLPTKNPPIEDNQLLVNAVHKNWKVEIDPVRCQPLIYDLENVEMSGIGKIIKDRSSTEKFADFLDNWRYLINIAVKPHFTMFQ